jgi:cytochrome o ubiquinol oxidase operon protein cyoD
MNTDKRAVVSRHDPNHGSLQLYVTGFVLSISLTIMAYLMVTNHTLGKWALVFAIATLAFIQFLVQLVFFLHLGAEAKPRWKLGVFAFMALIAMILVIGSLWIMNNLNYRMMSPEQINHYLEKQDGGI